MRGESYYDRHVREAQEPDRLRVNGLDLGRWDEPLHALAWVIVGIVLLVIAGWGLVLILTEGLLP